MVFNWGPNASNRIKGKETLMKESKLIAIECNAHLSPSHVLEFLSSLREVKSSTTGMCVQCSVLVKVASVLLKWTALSSSSGSWEWAEGRPLMNVELII
ncbi:hypothetical protein AgCh_002706 [Apium graveolens]